MIVVHRRQIEAICRQRGRALADAMPCVVAQDGDIWTIDETHAAYPRVRQPSIIQKAVNFATSAAAHVAAGMPQASREQIDARFAICQGCEHFDGRACAQCGCPIARENKFVSKLSWAGESCPVGKWGAVEPPQNPQSTNSTEAKDGGA